MYPEYPTPSPIDNESVVVRVAEGIWNIPPAGTRRPAGPNIARQLGMVTNAEIDGDGNVLLGTVHAAPYDPAIAMDITKICYPGGYKSICNPPNTKEGQEELKALEEKMAVAAYEYLDRQGLALDGLVHTLADRRIDIIAPGKLPDKGWAFASSMGSGLPRLPGRPVESTAGKVWVRHPEDRGVYIEQPTVRELALGDNHPLTKIHGRNYQAEDHTISTTIATHSPRVYQGLTILTKDNSSSLIQAAPGFSYQKEQEVLREKYKAVYQVPITEDTIAEIAEIERRMIEANEHAAAERHEIAPEDLSYDDHYHPDAAGEAIRDNELRLITAHLDPIDNAAWRARLS